MHDDTVTPTQQLVELRLGGDLAGYLARERGPADAAKNKSWRTIAADVRQRTGLDISYEAVRVWHAELVTRVAA